LWGIQPLHTYAILLRIKALYTRLEREPNKIELINAKPAEGFLSGLGCLFVKAVLFSVPA
jgi:hypothetical protein